MRPPPPGWGGFGVEWMNGRLPPVGPRSVGGLRGNVPRRRRRGRRRGVPVGCWLVGLLLAVVIVVLRCRPEVGRRVVPDVVPRLGPGALSGTTVVVDPGHGGRDPGAMNGGVAEAALTTRMAVVLREVLVGAGARVLTTVESSEWRRVWREGESEPPLALPRDAVFTWDGSPVKVGVKGDSGLYRRSAVAGTAWRSRSPSERVVFVSLHFDAVPGTDVRGAAVVHDIRSRRPELVEPLVGWLERAGLAAERPTVLKRDLGVLNPERNPVPESVLVEFATLTSAQDRAHVRDPRWRWRAARVLAAALAGPPPG